MTVLKFSTILEALFDGSMVLLSAYMAWILWNQFSFQVNEKYCLFIAYGKGNGTALGI